MRKNALIGGRGLSFYLSLITAFQILVGFGMQWYIVTYFGAGQETDALYTGATLPQVITALLIETLSVVFIPLLSANSERELHQNGWLLFLLMALLFTAISLMLFFAAPFLIPLIVPGFSNTAKQLTLSLTRIQVFGLIAGACYAVLAALYQVRHRFIWPRLSFLISAVVGWLFLIWKLPQFGIILAAWVQVLVVTLPVLFLLPGLGRFERPTWRPILLKQLWHRTRPLLLGKAYFMTSFPIDRFLASFLAPGSIVIFELAGRFYGAVLRTLGQGILTPFVPRLSRLAHEHNWQEFRALYRKQSLLMLMLTVIVVLGVVVAASIGQVLVPATPVRHVAGSLNSADLSKIFMVLILMAGLLPCAGLADSLNSAYYAQGDTHTPTKVGAVIYTFGIMFKVAGFFLGGIKGMALAVTIWAIIYCISLEYLLRKRTTKLIQKSQQIMREESNDRQNGIDMPAGLGKAYAPPENLLAANPPLSQ